jgi:hypothetical protein
MTGERRSGVRRPRHRSRLGIHFCAHPSCQARLFSGGDAFQVADVRGGSRSSTHPRKGRCSRIGRGQAAADRLKLAAGQRAPVTACAGSLVKAGIVRLKAGSRAPIAHLNYLRRDGTTRDGGRGQLYGPDDDRADGPAFVKRGLRIATSSASSSHPKIAIGSPIFVASTTT